MSPSEARKGLICHTSQENVLSNEAIIPENKTVRVKKKANDPESAMKRLVDQKLQDGNVRAAVRILSSDDCVAPFSEEILEILQSKHPKGVGDVAFSAELTPKVVE